MSYLYIVKRTPRNIIHIYLYILFVLNFSLGELLLSDKTAYFICILLYILQDDISYILLDNKTSIHNKDMVKIDARKTGWVAALARCIVTLTSRLN